jgi:tRNA (Thr-GGU) A37 N-methylase
LLARTRPNPLGVHRVTVNAVDGSTRIHVAVLETIDGTPITDLEIVMPSETSGEPR